MNQNIYLGKLSYNQYCNVSIAYPKSWFLCEGKTANKMGSVRWFLWSCTMEGFLVS